MIKSILGGKSKNLFDKSNAQIINGYISGSNVFSKSFLDKTIIIPCLPNTTYTFSKISVSPVVCDRLRIGDYTAIPAIGDTINNVVNIGEPPTQNYITITTSDTAKYIVVVIGLFNQTVITTLDYILNTCQLELGSTATEYVPYELTSYKSIMKVSDVCQLVDKSKFTASGTTNGITWVSNGDGSITLNGTCTDGFALNPFNQQIPVDQTHFYYTSPYLSINYGGRIDGTYETGRIGYIKTSAWPTKFNTVFYIWIDKDKSFSNVTTFINIDDLTEMFGAGNELKTVAEFKAKFPNDYYPYSPSCFVTSFDERMPCKTKNLFDINAEMHNADKPNYYIEVMGNIVKTNYDISHTIHPYIEVSVDIGETYTFSCNAYRSSNIINVYGRVRYPDNTVVAYIGNGPQKKTFTATQSSIQVCFGIDTHGSSDTSQFAFIYDIQLVKGTTATDYVPYGYV